MVFLEVEMAWNVQIRPDQLDNTKGLVLKKAIILCLLNNVATKKASEEHGYYLAVISLDKIGEGMIRERTGDVLFPVTFKCLSQKPCKGERLVGEVEKILKHGVLLRSGPFDNVFLPAKKMGGYRFLPGENPVFLHEKHLNVEKGSMVRFKVLGFRWSEHEKAFQLLATLVGDFLGPI